jgi:hypothetical protein
MVSRDMSADASTLGLGKTLPAGLDLGASEGLFRQIADLAPAVMVVAVEPDYRIVYANLAAGHAARCEPDALIGRLVTEAFEFVDPLLIVAKPRAQIARQDGATGPIWWDVSYTALSMGSDPPALLITAVDVTRHENAMAKAQRAEDTLDALLTYIPDGISIAHGPEVHVERVSARGMAMVATDRGVGGLPAGQRGSARPRRPAPGARHAQRRGDDERDADRPAPRWQLIASAVQFRADP